MAHVSLLRVCPPWTCHAVGTHWRGEFLKAALDIADAALNVCELQAPRDPGTRRIDHDRGNGLNSGELAVVSQLLET